MKSALYAAAALLLCVFASQPAPSAEIFVATTGSDANQGTLASPLATLERAQQAARKAAGHDAVTVFIRQGVYYLPETLVFSAEDSGSKAAPVIYAAYHNEQVVVSGGVRLKDLKWEPYKNGILQAKAPADLATDQLFVNGQQQPLARYPNFNPRERNYNGWAADAISPQRAARWADPAGGFIHALHAAEWGDMHYLITGKEADNRVTYEGGWQNNRPAGMHDRPLRREHFRGTRRAGRVVPQPQDQHALLLSSGWRRSGQSDHRSGPPAASGRVPRHRAVARAVRQPQGAHVPPRRADVHGEPGAAAAQRLDDLSRRRGLLQRRGGLRAGELLHRAGRRQRGLREQLQSPRRRPRLPHYAGGRQAASPSSAIRRPAATRIGWRQRNQTQPDRPDARPQDRQLPRRLPGGGLPDPPHRPGGEADGRRQDRHGPRHHRPALLDLRRAAGRHQHRRRLLGRAHRSSSATSSTR